VNGTSKKTAILGNNSDNVFDVSLPENIAFT
jgi:hypothetical protein